MSKAFGHYGLMYPVVGCVMKLRTFSVAMVVLACVVNATPTHAAVNLELRPVSTMVVEGSTVDVGIYAVADSGVNEEMSGLDMVITWDSSVLGSVAVVPGGGFNWNLNGNFVDDSGLDGLNNFLDDGDAWFQAGTFSPAVATPEGLLATTLRFSTLTRSLDAPIAIVLNLGTFSRTKVYKYNAANVNITGTLGTTSVGVLCPACLIAPDIRIPAGRLSNVIVSGEIVEQMALGVSLVVQLVGREGNTGAVHFSQAPPIDISQWGDPWPNGGLFSPFDTDIPGFSSTVNGSVDDNGTLLDVMTTYGGPLTGFPVVSSSDASGVWDVLLTSTGGDASWDGIWQPLETVLIAGTIEIVEPDVVGGHDAIDMVRFSELQRCFTGAVGPVEPPAYEVTPELDCSLFDDDEDGDVDGDDYETFHHLQYGPGL